MFEVSLTTDVAASLKSMEGDRGVKRVSWSRFQHYEYCQAYYFLANFNKTINPSLSLPEDTNSMEGKMIQKILEVYYKNTGFANQVHAAINAGKLQELAAEAVATLFTCTRITPKAAVEMGITDVYKWLDTPEGSEWRTQRWNGLRNSWVGREIIDTRASLIVLDDAKVQEERGKTTTQLLSQVVNMTAGALADLSVKFPRQRTGTEVWVDTEQGGFQFCAMVDYIVNTHYNDPTPAKLWQIKQDYIIADGKKKINSYQNHDQIQFGATIIKARQRVTPISVALYDYSKSQPWPVAFDPHYGLKIVDCAKHLAATVNDLQNKLRSAGDRVQEPWKLLPRTPGQGCTFCPANQQCEYSTALKRDDRTQRRVDIQEAEAILAEAPRGTGPHELSI